MDDSLVLWLIGPRLSSLQPRYAFEISGLLSSARALLNATSPKAPNLQHQGT